ncbi:Shedu immune nuclease family protein [Corynebacterium sp. HMSC064E08]|uniref:Shedu immune nuclease family protein n=1 Tax=Corynebacterium sp. HMSC064E08 TaxID=1739324 RepID=UPI0008A2ECCF|nr:Shedu immune nuclease family protein [Corynebacterium sp. HMSC064E08]OFK33261.1 hypothetical protein HMPREF2820_04465 [Corynebacterium sp. HMSC064E08]
MNHHVDEEGFARLVSTEPTDVDFFLGRLEHRTYLSRSFENFSNRDKGKPSRYVWKVFEKTNTPELGLTGQERAEVTEIPAHMEYRRRQLKVHVVREPGVVREIRIQAQRKDPNDPKLDDLIILNREGSNKLIDLIRSLDSIPVTGEKTSRVDDDVLTRIIDDQSELQRLYEQDPEAIQTLVETETSAAEIKELKNRRDIVDTMQSWLDDDEAFAEAKAAAGGAEKAWQNLLEANPWVLGVGLGGRLYTTWDEGKLEQTVRGANLHTSGKRADAFLVSNGLLRSVALAEIKHPNTPLLTRDQYRSDVYAISREFSGAIAQAQETVRAAKEGLAGWIAERDDEGGNTGDGAYLVEPRSFLVIGSMSDLCSANGNRIDAKFRSFESFRSNLRSPEVLTFDELVERARWNVELAKRQDETETDFSDTEF